jgi:hypothetical protein
MREAGHPWQAPSCGTMPTRVYHDRRQLRWDVPCAALPSGSLRSTWKKYAQRFAENAIDLSVVRDLPEQDLKHLGVLLGHRRKLLRAIADLDGAALPKSALPSAPRDDAGRRQLTIMFCDLVGSTALSARLDPEDLRAVIGAYHGCIAQVIGRYGEWSIAFLRSYNRLPHVLAFAIAHRAVGVRAAREGANGH